MRPPPEARGHFPSIVLILGEPHPGGLADRMRRRLRERFGSPSAVLSAHLGDLRLYSVLRGTARALDPRALERWAASVLQEVLARHDGTHPARPQLPIVLVADGNDPDARQRMVDGVLAFRHALTGRSLPAGLAPRVSVVVAWPDRDPLPTEAAARAAWVRDIAHLAGPAEALNAAIVLGRSRYPFPRGSTNLPLLSDAERDEVIVSQVGLVVSTSLLDDALALTRGRVGSPWMAFGTAPAGDLAAPPWPWICASDGDWGGWYPRPACWSLGAGSTPRTPRLVGATEAPLLVSCLAGIPARFLAGCSRWEDAYCSLPFEDRLRLHRLEEACPTSIDPPSTTVVSEAVAEELVP